MTLNDLEPPEGGGLVNFSHFTGLPWIRVWKRCIRCTRRRKMISGGTRLQWMVTTLRGCGAQWRDCLTRRLLTIPVFMLPTISPFFSRTSRQCGHPLLRRRRMRCRSRRQRRRWKNRLLLLSTKWRSWLSPRCQLDPAPTWLVKGCVDIFRLSLLCWSIGRLSLAAFPLSLSRPSYVRYWRRADWMQTKWKATGLFQIYPLSPNY